MDILVNVINQKLKTKANTKRLVSGTQKFIRFKFSLDDAWDGLSVFAQFIQNGKAYNDYLDENNSVYLPPEIKDGKFDVLLYGSGSNTIATTNYLTFEVDKNILISDAQSTEITESLYNKLVNIVETLPISGNADKGAAVIGKESVELDGATYKSRATGLNAVAEGIGTSARGSGCHTEGKGTIASRPNAHAEGFGSQAVGNAAHAEGTNTLVSGDYAHAEGDGTIARGYASHAEGGGTTVSGEYAHAEGSGSTASGNTAHAEGGGTQATANSAHAEGAGTQATAYAAHAEGGGCVASGEQAHAEGAETAASGANSHAEGYNTLAKNAFQHVGGMYNVQDPSTADSSQQGTYAEIIGNGTSDAQRSNARTLDWQGNEALAGGLTLGMGTSDEITITPVQLKSLLALLQ